MKLIKTTFFSGIITFIKIVSGFISTKIVATIIGPSGVAMVGAFSNFIAIILTFSNGAINNGVVKYTAEYTNRDASAEKKLFSTSLRISFYCSLLIAVLLIFFSKTISSLIFKNDSFYDVILILGFCIFFYSLNSLLISILNGLGKIKAFTIINAIGSIVGLILTILLVYYFQVRGALYALVLAQTVVFFITLIFIIKKRWLNISAFKGNFDKKIYKNLKKFSFMAIVTAVTVPVAQILIRNMITSELTINDAGIWQGMMRISDGYLMLINTALLTYYLPRLSSLSDKMDLRLEIIKGYKILIPITIILSTIIYLFRHNIVILLYNDSFRHMESLFIWQLIGDFFKIMSYILAYLMLAKAMMKIYIITEIVFSASYVFLSFVFLKTFGLEGSVYSFAMNYFLYFVTVLILFKKILKK